MIQLTLETAKQNPISFKPVYSAIENCPQYQSIKLRRGFTWTLMKSEKKLNQELVYNTTTKSFLILTTQKHLILEYYFANTID